MGCVQSSQEANNKPVRSISGGAHYPNFTKPYKKFSYPHKLTR